MGKSSLAPSDCAQQIACGLIWHLFSHPEHFITSLNLYLQLFFFAYDVVTVFSIQPSK
jgi:hypothetical protein